MIHYAWSRLGETSAPLEVIENRFPALFEARRMLYPRFAEFADPVRYDQGIGGLLDHFQRASFVAFFELPRPASGLRSPRSSAPTLMGFRSRSRTNSSPTLTRSW